MSIIIVLKFEKDIENGENQKGTVDNEVDVKHVVALFDLDIDVDEF